MPVHDAILIDLLVGALVICLAWALGSRVVRRNAGAAAGLAALVVGVVGFCHLTLVPTLFRGWLRIDLHRGAMTEIGDERQAAAFADAFAPLLASRAFQQRLKSRREEFEPLLAPSLERTYEALTIELMTAGFARLSPGDVNAVFRVRSVLAEISPPLCGAWLRDRFEVAPEIVAAGLRGLNESDRLEWIALSARALALELDAIEPAPRISRAAVDAAMADVMRALPREQQAAVEPLYETFNLPPDQACEAFHALAAGMKRLTPVARATLMRSLDHPELVQ
jgi:hypothetical protein